MKKILIVEDDPYVRKVYERLFSLSKYEIVQAADGQEGLKLAREKSPDIILLDLMLPIMSGIDVLRNLKADEGMKAIPVLILSNLGEDDIMKTALDLGAADYMVKAYFTPQQVLEQVEKHFLK